MSASETNLFHKTTIKNRMISGICCLFLFLVIELWLSMSYVLAAGSNETVWTREYGGKGDQAAYSIRPTTDGGFIVAGSSDIGTGGVQNIYLLHTDALGNPLWEKTLDSDQEQIACSVEPVADGGCVVGGSVRSADSEKAASIYIAKTDRLGNRLWDRRLSGTKNACARAVKNAMDGALVVTGCMQNERGFDQAYLLEIDNNGKVVWENVFASANAEELLAIAPAKDGGYLLCGYAEVPATGQRNILLIKTDAGGNLQWRRVLPGNMQTAGSILAIADGYLLAGYQFNSNNVDASCFVAKIDANGTKLWEKSFVNGNENVGYTIDPCTDGSYILFSHSRSSLTGLSGTCLTKIDAQGNKLSDLNLRKAGPETTVGGICTTDGACIVLGNKIGSKDYGKNICLVKVKFSVTNTANQGLQKGSFIWPDQSEYRGDLQNGKANGWGKVIYTDGGSYEGEWRDNLYNGQGTLITPDGSKYKGGFKDNMYYGKGTYTWPGGESYAGDYRYNKRNGEGTFTWPGGIKYSGEWLDNKAHGYGIIVWPNRETYSGEMNDGQATGLGSYTFSNGEKYVGQFSNLIFEGCGTYIWTNGARYTGEFKKDMMNGQGTYIWPNGVQQWGYWRDDKYIGLYPEGFAKKDK